MWKNVSRTNPCPVCGKPDWCSITQDGTWVACRRVDDGQAQHRIDKAGIDYWLYRLSGIPASSPAVKLPELISDEGRRAEPETLNRVYSYFLQLLTLQEKHQENLRKRGLSDTEITRRGYKSLPQYGRAELARELINVFSQECCAKVPGLYIKGENGRKWWSIAGPAGMIIPCRDLEGRVTALKIRVDNPNSESGGKYVYISSRSYAGPGPGAQVHVPIHDFKNISVVRITEGELKADIATVLSGILTLSIPGVSCWQSAIPVLKSLNPKQVLLAFDSDWRENPCVARALVRTTRTISEEGYDVLMETWDPAVKGIDDLLAAGGKPETKKPEEILVNAEKVALENDPVKKILRKIEGNWPSIFATENVRLIANLTENNLARLEAEIKNSEAKKVISVSMLKKLVKQARARLRAEERGLEVLPGSGNPEVAGRRTIVSRFPPAQGVIPDDFPFPETGERHSFFDIRGGKVIKVITHRDNDGDREEIIPVVDTVVLLIRRVDPVERDTGMEKWTIVWWERNRWRCADVPARFLFDRKKVGELVDVGLPVSSANVDELITWLHALRVLAVLGHQNAPELPTIRAVSRCGWHELGGEKFFVVGPEILRPDGSSKADAGDRDEIQKDAGVWTDADVRWAEDISALERQILSSFRMGGDLEEHKRLLIDVMMKYPQLAFGLGAAAGAPLLRFAQAAGMIDVAGYCVFMAPRAGGRSRHQGKSTWNAVVASLYGWPGTGESGRLRFADRTRVAAGVLFSTNCDLTVHIEELQYLARASKKESAQELAHLIHQVSSGMDRERGARGGGGRRTRGFHLVLLGTAETDVTVNLPVESGAHDRVLKLPPLLTEENDRNRNEAERLLRAAMTNYGHAGREYLAWLVRRMSEENFANEIREEIKTAIDILRKDLPTDARRASAGRIATRAAVALAGLAMLLNSWDVTKEIQDKCFGSFMDGWEMVVDGISTETVADRALSAVQAYITQNVDQIKNLRESDKPPQRWVGTYTMVKDDDNSKDVAVVALTESAFAEAVSKEPFDLDAQHALQALASAGHIVTRTIQKGDGKTTKRTKLEVRVDKGAKAWCICIRADLVIDQKVIEAEIGTENPFYS